MLRSYRATLRSNPRANENHAVEFLSGSKINYLAELVGDIGGPLRGEWSIAAGKIPGCALEFRGGKGASMG